MNVFEPLKGIRVLDLTRNVAGPFATMVLADLGAMVTKLERPDGGDDTRQWGPPFHEGESAMFLQLNRNKRSMALDLSAPDAKATMTRLVRESDVIVESFRPGALDALGYGYTWAASVKPDIIFASATGFGHIGPLKERPGYDPLLQAFAGLMSITGEESRPPVRVGFSVVDIGTGMWTALAVMAALRQRDLTGQGANLTTSLYETAIAWAMLPLSTYWASGDIPQRYGSGISTIVPYRAYQAKDGYIIIAAGNDQLFAKLCATLGFPELARDARFLSNPDRVSHRSELDSMIAEAVARYQTPELIELLNAKGIPCSSVRTLADVAQDEQAAALGIFQRPESGELAKLPVVGLPFVVGDVRPRIRAAAPRLGEHNQEIMAELNSDADTTRQSTRD